MLQWIICSLFWILLDIIFWYIEKEFFIYYDQYNPDVTGLLYISTYTLLASNLLKNNRLEDNVLNKNNSAFELYLAYENPSEKSLVAQAHKNNRDFPSTCTQQAL